MPFLQKALGFHLTLLQHLSRWRRNYKLHCGYIINNSNSKTNARKAAEDLASKELTFSSRRLAQILIELRGSSSEIRKELEQHGVTGNRYQYFVAGLLEL